MIKYFEEKGIELGFEEFIIWVLEENIIGKNCYLKNNYIGDGKTKIFKRFNKQETRYIKKKT